MCASYGIDGAFGIAPRRAGGSGVRFVEIATEDRARSREILSTWAQAQGGHARITGRHARNLNPLIHEGAGERRLDLGWWWLHVAGEPAPYSAFNARDDKLLTSWREPFQRRALLPATWYTEKGRDFGLDDGEMFGIAAIVTPVAQAPGDGPLYSYAMVTRAAVAEANAVHHRMPLVLPREMHDEWLAPARRGDESLVQRALEASEPLSRQLQILPRQEPESSELPAVRGDQGAPTLF